MNRNIWIKRICYSILIKMFQLFLHTCTLFWLHCMYLIELISKLHTRSVKHFRADNFKWKEVWAITKSNHLAKVQAQKDHSCDSKPVPAMSRCNARKVVVHALAQSSYRSDHWLYINYGKCYSFYQVGASWNFRLGFRPFNTTQRTPFWNYVTTDPCEAYS